MARPKAKPADLRPPPSYQLATPSIRLFEPADIQALAEQTETKLAPDRSAEQVASRLNIAFSLAFRSAEAARADLTPAELRDWCENVVTKAEQLLLALGYPSDPRYFTHVQGSSLAPRGGVEIRETAAYHHLKRAVMIVEPKPTMPDETLEILRVCPGSCAALT